MRWPLFLAGASFMMVIVILPVHGDSWKNVAEVLLWRFAASLTGNAPKRC